MGSQQTSPNTERLMAIAKNIFIILISIVGPILEEFVFRVSLANYIMQLKPIALLAF